MSKPETAAPSAPVVIKRTLLSTLPGPVLVGKRWVAPGHSEVDDLSAEEVTAMQSKPYLKVLAAA